MSSFVLSFLTTQWLSHHRKIFVNAHNNPKKLPMNSRDKALEIQPLIKASPLPGYEYGSGYGIMALSFASSHVLALRVFPENDFAPYKALWHRTPDHRWSIYVDGPRHDTACPRYCGKAVAHVQTVSIRLAWKDAHSLTIEMDQPVLHWTVVMKTLRCWIHSIR